MFYYVDKAMRRARLVNRQLQSKRREFNAYLRSQPNKPGLNEAIDKRTESRLLDTKPPDYIKSNPYYWAHKAKTFISSFLSYLIGPKTRQIEAERRELQTSQIITTVQQSVRILKQTALTVIRKITTAISRIKAAVDTTVEKYKLRDNFLAVYNSLRGSLSLYRDKTTTMLAKYKDDSANKQFRRYIQAVTRDLELRFSRRRVGFPVVQLFTTNLRSLDAYFRSKGIGKKVHMYQIDLKARLRRFVDLKAIARGWMARKLEKKDFERLLGHSKERLFDVNGRLRLWMVAGLVCGGFVAVYLLRGFGAFVRKRREEKKRREGLEAVNKLRDYNQELMTTNQALLYKLQKEKHILEDYKSRSSGI